MNFKKWFKNKQIQLALFWAAILLLFPLFSDSRELLLLFIIVAGTQTVLFGSKQSCKVPSQKRNQ